MSHPCKIAGRDVALEWTQESAKRYAYRIGCVGGEPSEKEFRNPKTLTTALFKVLWALLPAGEFHRYADPEALFVAVDHENEAEAIYNAINGVFRDRLPDAEKKSTSMTSPSPESSSG